MITGGRLGILAGMLLATSFATAQTRGPAAPGSSIRLLDLAGQRVDPFGEVAKKAIVFLFVRTDCPISNRYAPEVHRLVQKFAPRGVAFKLVYVDPSEPSQQIREHTLEYGYQVATLRDNEHTLVHLTGAKVTPEVAVFVWGESGARLVYRGRIDDRYVDFGKTRPAPTTHDLDDVLQAIVQDRTLALQTTHAVGCFIQDLK
jgi:hypothetical protein